MFWIIAKPFNQPYWCWGGVFGLITPAGLIGKLFGRDDCGCTSTTNPPNGLSGFETNIGGSLPPILTGAQPQSQVTTDPWNA